MEIELIHYLEQPLVVGKLQLKTSKPFFKKNLYWKCSHRKANQNYRFCRFPEFRANENPKSLLQSAKQLQCFQSVLKPNWPIALMTQSSPCVCIPICIVVFITCLALQLDGRKQLKDRLCLSKGKALRGKSKEKERNRAGESNWAVLGLITRKVRR